MCRAVRCRSCGGTTWSGCGMHVVEVMRGVPKEARCTCDPDAPRPGRFAGLFSRKG